MLEVFLIGNNFYICKDGNKINLNNENNKFEADIRMFLCGLEDQEVCGKKINEMYIYDNIELYNFCRGSIYDRLKDVLNKFCFIENLIKSYDEDIKVNTDDIVYKYIVEEIFKLECNYEEKVINKINDSNKIAQKVIRIAKGLMYFIKYKIKNKYSILFLTQANSINSININGKEIKYDSQFGKILDYFKDSRNTFILQYLNNKELFNKAKALGDDFFPFENFIIMKKIFFKLKIDKYKLKDNLDCIKDLNYTFHGFDICNLVNIFIFNNIKELMNSYLYEIYAAEKFIKLIGVEKVVAIDEADRLRCFIYAANKLGKPSFAIQHGIITLGSNAYFIPTNDKIYIPRITFVWGNIFKNILIDNTQIYNNNNIDIVGQIRTDYLFEKLNEENLEDNIEEVKILYATQYIEELTSQATNMLFDSLSKLEKNFSIIIKLHPNDKYEDLYSNLIEKYNIKNVTITRDMDIYDAIKWSDVVISVHSTVNLEASILNKPSICILLDKYWDEGNFVKNKISIGAKNQYELKEYIEKIYLYSLNNKEVIEDYFYKVDGMVSMRIINKINEINNDKFKGVGNN
ncbi:UDP-N-acetylglucosamine 2-epimerase [Clostridium sartagoforme]|uniref:UDP-N-acetylglucosamine 2-epimerase n=1 Tax=Clostridium sartagoforme TaxID=84031 RepID=UPI0031DB49D6